MTLRIIHSVERLGEIEKGLSALKYPDSVSIEANPYLGVEDFYSVISIKTEGPESENDQKFGDTLAQIYHLAGKHSTLKWEK